MSARITRKRARYESTVSQEPEDGVGAPEQGEGEGRKRDEEFWFEDGTVILIARDVEFRVFKGILADHSPVFKDMFSLPQPPEDATASCPVVHVTDSPEDLRHLLRIGSSPFLPDDPSFDLISATIRIGHKYQISKLVEHSVDYLKVYYTTVYDEFSKRGRTYWPPSFKEEHAIGVINLARLTGEHSLLPVAFFICCTLGKRIVKGFQREDGSWEQLSLDDLGVCIEGTAKLVASRAKATIYVLGGKVDEDCEDPDKCLEVFHDVLDLLTAEEMSIPDPFYSVYSACRHDLELSLCHECLLLLEAYDNGQRRDIWDERPSFFDLDASSG